MFSATWVTSSSSKQYLTSGLIASRTFASGPLPSATPRIAMSRSVSMPTSLSFSATGSSPASIFFIRAAAPRSVSSGLTRARTHKSACVGARLCQCPLHSETDPSAALPRIDAMCHFRTHALQQNIREGLSRGQFRVLACRVPFLQILRNQLPPQVACEIARPLLSSTAAGLPSSQVPDSSLLRRLLSFARWRLRGKLLPRSCLYLDPLCSFNTHSTGTSAGAPLFLIKNTRNFAGLVLLAFRSTT